MSSTETKVGRGERRFVIAYGEMFSRRVERAPESYGDNLLTREEAAQRIADEAAGAMDILRQTRRYALRVLREERKKASRATGSPSHGPAGEAV